MKTPLTPFSAACCASKHNSAKSTSTFSSRACARLLCARRSHSRGSMGGHRLGFIDDLPLADGRTYHQAMCVTVTLHFFGSYNYRIHTDFARQTTVNRRRNPITAELSALDDKEVEIAIRP